MITAADIDLIEDAAATFDGEALCLRHSHTVGPEYQDWADDMAAKAVYDRFITQRDGLYALAVRMGWRGGAMIKDAESQVGHDALWLWFGLSRASFLTLPRVMMHAMPDDWQARMAELLNEYDAEFSNQPDMGTRVQITQQGKLIKTPEWLINYRRPDERTLQDMRRPAS